MRSLAILFLTSMCFAVSPLIAADVVLGKGSTEISPIVEYWTDISGEESIQNVKKHAFQPFGARPFDLGIVKGSVWLRVKYKIDPNSSLRHVLTFSKIHLREIDAYQFVDGELIHSIATGEDRPYDSRDLRSPTWSIQLVPAKGNHELFVRVETRSPLRTDIYLETDSESIQRGMVRTFYYSGLIGFLCFMGVVTAFLAASTKQHALVLGLALVMSAILEMLSSSGLGFAFIWPDYPFLNPVAARMGIALTLGLTGFYCIEFLNIHRFAPKLARLTKLASCGLIIAMTLPLPAISAEATVAVFILVPALILLCLISSWRHSVASTAYFLLGFGAFLTAVIISVMASVNLLPLSVDYGNVFDAGLMAMFVLFGYAMIQRLAQQTFESAVSNASIKAKSLFFATMSHEIRTPINGVLGMLNLLIKDHLNEPQQRLAVHAKSSAESLLHIVNEILDYSKIEAGKLDIEAIQFNVVQLLEETVDAFACLENNQHVDIILDTVDLQTAQIVSDPSRLKQILNNLISNALKFTASGEIEISARLDIKAKQHRLCISVRDTGIGIEPDQIPRLFTMFTQADESTTRNYGGTGLGLAIAQQLCELMGGEISATSRPGIGSVFSFFVQVQPGEITKNLFPPSIKGKTVLIHDSNASSLRVLTGQLKKINAEVITAKSAEDFLQLTDKHRPDITVSCDTRAQPEQSMFFTVTRAGNAISFAKPITESKLQEGVFGRPTSHISASALDPTKPKPHRLLLVEDNFINTEVALGILEDFGYSNIALAENGKQAVDKLREENFDLVLMDCHMPIMDGYDATKQIRSGLAGDQINVPVIAMTANAMEGDREKCLAVGMNDYIAKPIDPDRFVNTLEQWL